MFSLKNINNRYECTKSTKQWRHLSRSSWRLALMQRRGLRASEKALAPAQWKWAQEEHQLLLNLRGFCGSHLEKLWTNFLTYQIEAAWILNSNNWKSIILIYIKQQNRKQRSRAALKVQPQRKFNETVEGNSLVFRHNLQSSRMWYAFSKVLTILNQPTKKPIAGRGDSTLVWTSHKCQATLMGERLKMLHLYIYQLNQKYRRDARVFMNMLRLFTSLTGRVLLRV